jgi:hypothetical protein
MLTRICLEKTGCLWLRGGNKYSAGLGSVEGGLLKLTFRFKKGSTGGRSVGELLNLHQPGAPTPEARWDRTPGLRCVFTAEELSTRWHGRALELAQCIDPCTVCLAYPAQPLSWAVGFSGAPEAGQEIWLSLLRTRWEVLWYHRMVPMYTP